MKQNEDLLVGGQGRSAESLAFSAAVVVGCVIVGVAVVLIHFLILAW